MPNPNQGEEQNVEALQAEVTRMKEQLNNVVEELKTSRTDKQALEAERDLLLAKISKAEETTPPAIPDVETTIRKVLSERDQEDIAKNREAAEKQFKANNKEFSADSDPGGIKYAALKKKLSRISSEGLKSVEDFLGMYNDALVLLRREPTIDGTTPNPFASTPSDMGVQPKSGANTGLTFPEQKLIKEMGWTEERYLKVKASRPGYVAKLLEYSSK